MDDDKLIKLVEAREVIYNRHHPDYKYQDRKEAAFIEIAEELGVPGKNSNYSFVIAFPMRCM